MTESLSYTLALHLATAGADPRSPFVPWGGT